MSLDELPTTSVDYGPKKDDRLYVKLARDNKQRLWATLAELTDFEADCQAI